MKIETVNVIELSEGMIVSVESFKDNEKGNEEAIELFKDKAYKNGASNYDLDNYVADGVCGIGIREVYLIKSK